MRDPGDVRIGISGWRYAGWRGSFYPEGLRQADELSFAARNFRTIEINGTFYSLQRPESFAAWAAATPDDFVFAVKGPRYITHILRLRDVATPLANFFASGLLCLGPRLGPLLWQFPATFKFDPGRLEAFFDLLPRDTRAAAAQARRHNEKVEGRTAIPEQENRPLRHAIEVRSESFRTPQFIELLRTRDIGLVCADAVEWPRLMDVTSDFVYCRLHGSEVLYTSGYDDAALDTWADRVAAWVRGGEPADAERVVPRPARQRNARDVYVFFDNDAKVRAPADAKGLERRVRERLGQ